MSAEILVVGLGNTLAGDDGVGIAVVECLRAAGLPPGMRAEIGGTDSLCLAEIWKGERQIWFVDAVIGGEPPGTVHRLEHRQLLEAPQTHRGAHQLSLAENLRWLLLAHRDLRAVRFHLWGVEPGELRTYERLSPPVARAANGLCDRIRLEALAASECEYS